MVLCVQKHGLKAHIRQTSSFTPTRDGSKYLMMGRDGPKTLSEIAKFSTKDAAVYSEYERNLERYGTFRLFYLLLAVNAGFGIELFCFNIKFEY